jgi:hypothetical protein
MFDKSNKNDYNIIRKGGLMDLEKEAMKIEVDTEATSDIATTCNRLLELREQIKEQKEKLKSLEEQERRVSEHEVPDLMRKAGVSGIKLPDGSSVEVKVNYAAKIPVSKKDEAYQWLRDNNFDHIIKNDVVVSFGRYKDNEAVSLLEDLKGKGHNVVAKTKIEPQTLKSFVKEEINKGNSVPMELFGVYVHNETKIK